MLKIYASGIRDLTVARYFAAMQVDLAGFEVDANNLLSIAGIKEWIEGPLSVCEPLHGEYNTDVMELFRQSGMDYLLIPQELFLEINMPAVVYLPYGAAISNPGIYQVRMPETVSTKEIDLKGYLGQSDCQIYFDLPNLNEEWLSVLEGHDNLGIVIRAGIEDRPGIKSFDIVDTLFEKLGR